jgi:hypothetical protein
MHYGFISLWVFNNILGLLIEPSRDYERLMKKNRKAKSLNVCLATKTVPHVVDFYNYDMIGGIKGALKLKFSFAHINHKTFFYDKILSVDDQNNYLYIT